jgi:diaminohydroxyphosphoribosylaminopyrimidine deaminase / 5-amino-6-(5-phosphoribosylamino)uracil reductase
VMIDCAPLLLGGRTAPGPLGGAGFAALSEAARLDDLEARQRGGDLILTGYRKGCLPELFKSVGA